MKRRTLIASAALAMFGARCSSADRQVERQTADKHREDDQKNFDDLIQGKYKGLLRLGYQEEYFINDSFRIDKVPATWNIQSGKYGNITGYWIFLLNVNKCWQAPGTRGVITYWEGSSAHGDPEDWELFRFEKADPDPRDPHDPVRRRAYIRQVWGTYVRYDQNRLIADADRQRAFPFKIVFI